MRIISSYHDYYDCIQKEVYCPEPLFVRNKTEIEYDYRTFPFDKELNLYIRHIKTINRIIYFCGKVYTCIKICEIDDNNIELHSKYCYSNQDAVKFVENLDKSITKNLYKKQRHWPYFGQSGIDAIKKYFENFKSKEDYIKKAFKQINQPIAVSYSSNKIVINDILKNIDFQRIIPPQQAFQEIQMWLSNIAVPQKPIPLLSNNDMILSKGFDAKHSFRKGK